MAVCGQENVCVQATVRRHKTVREQEISRKRISRKQEIAYCQDLSTLGGYYMQETASEQFLVCEEIGRN